MLNFPLSDEKNRLKDKKLISGFMKFVRDIK
jgi:hypothetical protein